MDMCDSCKDVNPLVLCALRVLQVKYQLIYAVGDALRLANLEERYEAIAAVAKALLHDPAVAATIFSDPRACLSRRLAPASADAGTAAADTAACSAGAFFAELRLLPGDALDRVLPKLCAAVARHVIANPPHELRWLKESEHYAGWTEEVLVRYVTDADTDADLIIAPADFGRESHRAGLLALRGLLAYGTLAHCLRMRHRVEYGVDRHAGRKRLAVPFRACDEPRGCSEFAHPDTALALTVLSYYYDGLSDSQVLQAFEKLLQLGLANQHARYSAWFEAARPGLTEEEAKALDDVRKVDLTNAVQVKQLQRAFRLSCGLIDFWLMICVLPTETVRSSPPPPVGLILSVDPAALLRMRCGNRFAERTHRLVLRDRQPPRRQLLLQLLDGRGVCLVACAGPVPSPPEDLSVAPPAACRRAVVGLFRHQRPAPPAAAAREAASAP